MVESTKDFDLEIFGIQIRYELERLAEEASGVPPSSAALEKFLTTATPFIAVYSLSDAHTWTGHLADFSNLSNGAKHALSLETAADYFLTEKQAPDGTYKANIRQALAQADVPVPKGLPEALQVSANTGTMAELIAARINVMLLEVLALQNIPCDHGSFPVNAYLSKVRNHIESTFELIALRRLLGIANTSGDGSGTPDDDIVLFTPGPVLFSRATWEIIKRSEEQNGTGLFDLGYEISSWLEPYVDQRLPLDDLRKQYRAHMKNASPKRFVTTLGEPMTTNFFRLLFLKRSGVEQAGNGLFGPIVFGTDEDYQTVIDGFGRQLKLRPESGPEEMAAAYRAYMTSSVDNLVNELGSYPTAHSP